MKRALIVVACLFLGLLLATPAAAADRQEVEFSDDEAGVLKVKPPKPEVTYLLLRAKLEQPATRPKVELAPRIERALVKAPF